MVTIILFIFLLNFRTTFISLAAMPLSFAITMLTFKWFGVSVNSMTLGGLAVAIGMVVDDAIVGVENVWRRLRENAAAEKPHPRLHVILSASTEVRNSIFYATVLIVLVFLPLLGSDRRRGPALLAHRHRHHHQHGRVVHCFADHDPGALLDVAAAEGRPRAQGRRFRPRDEVAARKIAASPRPESAVHPARTRGADRDRRSPALPENGQGLPARVQGGNRADFRPLRRPARRWTK